MRPATLTFQMHTHQFNSRSQNTSLHCLASMTFPLPAILHIIYTSDMTICCGVWFGNSKTVDNILSKLVYKILSQQILCQQQILASVSGAGKWSRFMAPVSASCVMTIRNDIIWYTCMWVFYNFETGPRWKSKVNIFDKQWWVGGTKLTGSAARRTNNRKVCITVLTGNRLGWTARCGRPPLLLPSCRKLEFRLSALMDSDLAWVNGKSSR